VLGAPIPVEPARMLPAWMLALLGAVILIGAVRAKRDARRMSECDIGARTIVINRISLFAF
jgi:hypothetical protein